MKIVSLIGARPQFIKEAMINKELENSSIEEIIVNSGQHYDYNMADVFFEKLSIRKPDYNLAVGSGLHGEMTARIMIEFEKILLEVKPDMVLVYGDTNTTLAGALVSAKLKIPLAHIEAGIRMLPKDMPEEINRVLTDRISSLLFCSSKRGVENLIKEGIKDGVHFTGDVTFDLFLHMEKHFDFSLYENLGLSENNYELVTLHRDYNVDNKERLENILKALVEIGREKKVIFPMHPRTRKRIEEFNLESLAEKITILEPVDYLSLMGLLVKSDKVITDSGGVQREAYFGKKEALLLMPDPAWHELVETNMNVLCEPSNLLERFHAKRDYKHVPNLYGEGNAAQKIVEIIKQTKD